MCLAEFPLPVIVYSNESPTAQAFTIAHELGHLILQQSGISGPIAQARSLNNEARVEQWCDRFAAAFLIPLSSLSSAFEKPSSPLQAISDENLNNLAKCFRVSRQAMLIRLVQLKYVESRFYWKLKKPEFDEEERKYKSRARSKYYGSRYKNSVGDLYTGLVMEAWNTGRITNHNAAEFMGIKNLVHLNDIKENFFS